MIISPTNTPDDINSATGGEFEQVIALNTSVLEAKISEEEGLEEALKLNYSDETSTSTPRLKHDSIPRLLDLALGITVMSSGQTYTMNERVRDVLNLDIRSIQRDINNFLSHNKEPQYRAFLNRVGKVLESILSIRSQSDIVNWNIIFSRLGN